MKITRVEPILIRTNIVLDGNAVPHASGAPKTDIHTVLVKVETDDGVTGWGEPVIEGRARTVEAAVHELSDYLIGQDPSRINDLWQTMYRAGFYRGGPILMSAIAGIDQALWDIKGKALGVPVYELLGGLVRDKMRTYSWVGGDRPSDVIAGMKVLQAGGFDHFKLKSIHVRTL